MDALWTTIFTIAAAAITFLITYFGISLKIGKYTDIIRKLGVAVMDVVHEIDVALKPDPDGRVTLTQEELSAIKAKVDVLIGLIKDLF